MLLCTEDMEPNDQQLVKDYLDGDEESFDVLLNRHLKPVYNFIYRICKNKEDTEEIVQDTFFKTWKNLKKYHEDQSFKTWLYTIAKNTTMDLLRKKKSLTFSELSDSNDESENSFQDNIADEAPLPDELFALAEKKKLLDNLLDRLPPIYKEVLLLKYGSELEFEEIAKILNKPPETIRSQHRRALIKLKECIYSQD